MPSAAFNITRLIAELGLKGVADLEIVQRIQPVLSVGDIADQTPPHVPPSALFGGFVGAVVAEVFVFELQCLAPGGAFVDWITYQSGTNTSMIIGTVAIAGAEAVVGPVGQASRDPVVSVARSGTHAFAGTTGAIISSIGNMHTFNVRSIFVPRGSFWSLQGTNVNQAVFFGLGWREVPATEHVPS